MITATSVPVLLILEEEQQFTFEVFSIGTSGDYVGIEDMEPFKKNDGTTVFLSDDHRDLRHRVGVKFRKTYIKYTNDDIMLLYEDALLLPNIKGILVLDITVPRVAAAKNVYDKAEYGTSRCVDRAQSNGTQFS